MDFATRSHPAEVGCSVWFSAANYAAAPLVELEREAGAEPPKINQQMLLTCAHVAHSVRVDRSPSKAETKHQNANRPARNPNPKVPAL